MIKAGDEKRHIAIQNKNVDVCGGPMCKIIAYSQWSKRSYKLKYNSFSGAVRNVNISNLFLINCWINKTWNLFQAIVIGFNTKKVLFVGIRNSYCSVCQRALHKKSEAPVHVCFVN